jgi:hypothetical protein
MRTNFLPPDQYFWRAEHTVTKANCDYPRGEGEKPLHPARRGQPKNREEKRLEEKAAACVSYNQKNLTIITIQLSELIAYGPDTFGAY